MNANKNRYTFKTVVAPEAVRADFTALRDQLGSSDKELMQALWNIGIDHLEDLKKEVEAQQESAALARAAAKEVKAAAKQKDKAPKAKKEKAPKVETDKPTVAKRVRKPKAEKVAPVSNGDETVSLVESLDDEAPVMVVVGG
jgi:uncharacterized protein YhaN